MANTRILFIFGDSPTRRSGFGRVVKNLLQQWMTLKAFDEIHVWGIGYWGNPHEFPGVHLWPAAGPADNRWESQGNLQRFADTVRAKHATHVWLLQDLWGVMPLSNVMEALTKKGVSTTLYFPVDAPLEPYWTRILASVKNPVAYCAYGRTQAAHALALPETPLKKGDDQKEWWRVDRLRKGVAERIRVIPHGVDAHWNPTPPDEKVLARKELFRGRVGEKDLLLLNVAMNQRRKGLTQSLQTLVCVQQQRPDAKLYLHMTAENRGENIHLGVIALQLGLVPDRDVFFGDRFHHEGHPTLDDQGMRLIYGSADLLLSTSLGEGWGLPVTEAMACGLPVAVPGHTSLREIVGEHMERGLLLPLAASDVMPGDNNRVRPRVDPVGAANLILSAMEDEAELALRAVNALAWVNRPELTWGAIAIQWLEVMG